jgi:hypothetical protein
MLIVILVCLGSRALLGYECLPRLLYITCAAPQHQPDSNMSGTGVRWPKTIPALTRPSFGSEPAGLL